MSRLAAVFARSALLTSLVLGTGCNSHLLTSPDAGPQIGDRGISVPVPPPSLKLMPVQLVDLTDNCIDVWSEDADGNSSVHSFYRASIDVDDQSVLTEQLFYGCP